MTMGIHKTQNWGVFQGLWGKVETSKLLLTENIEKELERLKINLNLENKA